MTQELIWKSARSGSILITVFNLLFLSCIPGQCNTGDDISAPAVVRTVDDTNTTPDPATMPETGKIPETGTLPLPSNKIDGNVTIKEKIKNHIDPSFKIAGSYSRRFQKYSGATSASEFITDVLLYLTLKKIFGGKVKVRVKTYSFTDLWHLKVRDAIVNLKGSHYKDIPLGVTDIESQTPFWFTLKHHRLEVMHPALFSFKMQISENELDKMLHSPRVTDSLRALRLDLASLGPGLGEQRLQMHGPEVTLEDDLIKVKANLATQGADSSTYVLMILSGHPKLHGSDRLFLEDVKIECTDIEDPEKFSKFVENLINPLINLNRFDKPNFAIRLDEITIKSKTMIVTGRVLLGPRVPKPSGK